MLRGAGAGTGSSWRDREAAKKAAGGSPAPAPAAAPAAQAPAADNDGFTEVKKNVYRPPGRRDTDCRSSGYTDTRTMNRITDPAVTRQAVSALYTDPNVDPTPTAARAPKDTDSISIRSRHTLRAFSTTAAADDDDEDPWSAIPRPPLNPSHPAPEEVITLPRAQRNQLLLRALLQLLALFVVCLIGLAGTLYLALPVISPADKTHLKIPRNFDDLQQLNTVLQHYKTEHFGRVLLCWVVVYMFLQAFSIPGSMYMSILAGALFGVPLALPLVCVSVATGASICYLISKFLGVVLIALPTWQRRVDEWKAKLVQHEDNLLSYLVVIRMMPLPPHNVVNVLAPHLGVGLGTFWLSTAGGIFASGASGGNGGKFRQWIAGSTGIKL
ncbi:hypothetical protein [Sporisorium scitamineum]|uniref:VTT domain-containing protein n=1 Tax=Sporisorium scitamineum TaxID=49012 RepID=A0A0F7SDG0_9BASI|nr:hypothetical protein [Sporisorium scitamineum]